MFSELNDGYCPQCMLNEISVALVINADDIWECPECHLQIHNCNFFFMAVMRQRGTGNLKDVDALAHIRGKILTKASTEDLFKADPSGFKDEDDFRDFLSEEVKGPNNKQATDIKNQ